MPILPNVLERFLIRRGMIPPLLLDLFLPMVQMGAILAALELRVFQHLADGPLELDELARKTESSPEGLRNLLSGLASLGYVEETPDGRFGLTDVAARTLPLDRLDRMTPFFRAQWEMHAEAVRGVREAPEEGIFGWEPVQSGELGRAYQEAMHWIASQSVDEVVGKVKLDPPPRRMLDVGGAHALYTVAFCRKYPGLEGTVLDWEIGLESARRTLAEDSGMAERIDLVARDFEKEDLPTGYDFAFLGNIVHGVSEEGNRELFRKLGAATTDRGVVALVDQLAGVSGSRFARTMASFMGLNLFLFSGGRAYEYEQLREWLGDAGFGACEEKKLRQPGFSLVIARKG